MPPHLARISQLTKWKQIVGVYKYQIHISEANNPFVNLSIEHYLLQKSPPNSTILFLYKNAPCVVIGRNQNPWLEVNLESRKVRRSPISVPSNIVGDSVVAKDGRENAWLVRRRSGGGAVFHDEDNTNFSVICPIEHFTRDRHTEVVTEAIREINLRARVNERHDIVLDQGNLLAEEEWPDRMDMHRSIYEPEGANHPPLKVSGSAYKLTRQRALHHGTCLLTCRDLPRISHSLNAPARPFIKARGVDSVRSPVGNVSNDLGHERLVSRTFQKQLIKVFMKAHGIKGEAFPSPKGLYLSYESEDLATAYVGNPWIDIEEIRECHAELKSSKWLYGQTPQFILSSHPTEEDERPRPPLPKGFPVSARVYLKVKGATIISSRISISDDDDTAQAEADRFDKVLKDKKIHEIQDFKPILEIDNRESSSDVSSIASWLNNMLGKQG